MVVVVANATVVAGLVPLTGSVEATAMIGVMVEGTVEGTVESAVGGRPPVAAQEARTMAAEMEATTRYTPL